MFASIFANLSIVLLGAFHAMEPGHGKSFIAGNMIAGKIKWRGLFSMLGGLLFSHFFLLAVLAYGISHVNRSGFLNLEQYQFKLIGSVLIVCLGLYLLIKYFRNRNEHHDCHCAFHEDNHISGRRATVIGLISGLLPCPSSLAALAIFGTANDPSDMLISVALYILGMTIALFALLVGINLLRHQADGIIQRVQQRFPPQLISAVVVLAVGCLYTFYQLQH